ncbi:MAG: isochorismatase family cysteine hydrolase [Butyribacter sp.]|nr:cysteine hydrolase [bacterium]MDY3854620.1 isochorismatase family cysteine hydrolase [Butyribacter sp.]
MKKILLVIDMQNDFVDGALGTKEAQAMVPALLHKIEEEVAKGTELIFTQDTHGENYMDTQEGRKLPVSHCIRGTSGWKIIPALQPYAKTVIEKPTFGSVQLPSYVKDADVIEIVGLCTDICVISNALLLKAHYPEKTIMVDAACCAGVTPESHQNALEAMKMCQIDIENCVENVSK